MGRIATFRIESSFNLTDRGIVALGQIIDGVVRIGAYTTFETGNGRVNMQISGVDMADTNLKKGGYAVGLTFLYKDENQQKEYETLKLKEQIIGIFDEPGCN